MIDATKTTRKFRRRSLAFFAAVTMGILGVTACSPAADEETVKISTQAVKRGDLVVGLYADGRVSLPSSTADFQIAGEIQEIKVAIGQAVLDGEVLAVLDGAEADEAVSDARAELDKARAVYEDAVAGQDYTLKTETIKLDSLKEKSEEKFNSLGLKDAVTEAEDYAAEVRSDLRDAEDALEEATAAGDDGAAATAEKDVEALENALRSAESSLGSLERSYSAAYDKYKDDKASAEENYELQKLKVANLKDSSSAVANAQFGVDAAQRKLDAALVEQVSTQLLAPAAGIVTGINVRVGDAVSGKAEPGAPAQFTISEDGTQTLTASINEGDIAQIEVGQVVKANIEALGLVAVPGKVSAVSRIPRIDNSGIVSYEVTAELDEADPAIFDGMSSFITFIQREKLDVLMISNKAIFIEDGQQYVQVQRTDGTLEKRAVTAGLTNGSVSEILEGLTEGENVVTSGGGQ